MNRQPRFCLAPLAVLAAAALPVAALAQVEFDEAVIYFELNDTDHDLGIHGSIDGGPYKQLTVTNSNGVEILDILAKSGVAKQGLSELFFESEEPTFDELRPAAFFRRFPAGDYVLRGVDLAGAEFQAIATVSHVMAAAAGNITVNGVPAAKSCDAVTLPSVTPPVVIDWDPVTTSHPKIGDDGPVEIELYQLVVERPEGQVQFDLPPDVTKVKVPAEILALGRRHKFEIIARTADHNQTAIETCFLVNR